MEKPETKNQTIQRCPNCAHCQPYVRLPKVPDDSFPIGECRRFSPVAHFVESKQAWVSGWPSVHSSQWCSLFQPNRQVQKLMAVPVANVELKLMTMEEVLLFTLGLVFGIGFGVILADILRGDKDAR